MKSAKEFDDKMSSDRRVTAYRAYARDNPLMRFICLRLLYHKSNRHKPTRRYDVLLPVAKGFGDKMSSDRRVSANRAYARDNPLMRFICLRLLYHNSARFTTAENPDIFRVVQYIMRCKAGEIGGN